LVSVTLAVRISADSVVFETIIVNDKSKERIVGSIVLLCLAIIFIPPFYDGRNPFDLDNKISDSQIPRAPSFKNSNEMANEIVNVGSGRIDKIEKKVKKALPESARSDSQLDGPEKNTYAEKLDDFNASEMTAQLLNDITKNSELAARFASKNNIKQAWAVQVGSFEEVNRAQTLRDELISKDFQAYIKTVLKDGKTISRVFAGVSLDKDVAEDIRVDLDKRANQHSAIVVPYQP
jgi:cell division septation protein DedD